MMSYLRGRNPAWVMPVTAINAGYQGTVCRHHMVLQHLAVVDRILVPIRAEYTLNEKISGVLSEMCGHRVRFRALISEE